MLRRVTVPALVVSVEAARAALRIDAASEGPVLERAIRAAQGMVEHHAQLAVGVADYEQDHPGWSGVEFDRAPVRQVVSASYLPGVGAPAVAVDPGLYALERTREGGRLRFGAAFSYPALTGDLSGPVVVRYRAGFDPEGTVGSDFVCPPEIVHAVILLAGHYHANREAVGARDGADVLPLGFEALVNTLTVYR